MYRCEPLGLVSLDDLEKDLHDVIMISRSDANKAIKRPVQQEDLICCKFLQGFREGLNQTESDCIGLFGLT